MGIDRKNLSTFIIELESIKKNSTIQDRSN